MELIKYMKRSPLFGPFLRQISYVLRPHIKHRFEIIEKEKINVALDIGANDGAFGYHLRYFGYPKRIISFEPVLGTYAKLLKNSSKDSLWECHNYALGNEETSAKINVLNCDPASSFLETNDLMMKAYGSIMNKQKEETVQIRRLDEVIPMLCKKNDSIFLKIDTQGYEKNVLIGAGEYLKQIKLVYLETSLVQVYKNEPTIAEIINFMEQHNFVPISVELEEWNKVNMQYLQVDVLFRNQCL